MAASIRKGGGCASACGISREEALLERVIFGRS